MATHFQDYKNLIIQRFKQTLLTEFNDTMLYNPDLKIWNLKIIDPSVNLDVHASFILTNYGYEVFFEYNYFGKTGTFLFIL